MKFNADGDVVYDYRDPGYDCGGIGFGQGGLRYDYGALGCDYGGLGYGYGCLECDIDSQGNGHSDC